MKKKYLIFILSVSTFFILNISAFAAKDTNMALNPTIEKYSGVTRSITKRYKNMEDIPGSVIYNSGGYCGQLPFKTWSYDKDFSTGKMWYVVIYTGTVSKGACPTTRIVK